MTYAEVYEQMVKDSWEFNVFSGYSSFKSAALIFKPVIQMAALIELSEKDYDTSLQEIEILINDDGDKEYANPNDVIISLMLFSFYVSTKKVPDDLLTTILRDHRLFWARKTAAEVIVRKIRQDMKAISMENVGEVLVSPKGMVYTASDEEQPVFIRLDKYNDYIVSPPIWLHKKEDGTYQAVTSLDTALETTFKELFN